MSSTARSLPGSTRRRGEAATQELPDYCARPMCRSPFTRVVGPGRPQAFCSEVCRRAAEKELRQAKSLLAHFEDLTAQLRIDIAAFGRGGLSPAIEPLRRNRRPGRQRLPPCTGSAVCWRSSARTMIRWRESFVSSMLPSPPSSSTEPAPEAESPPEASETACQSLITVRLIASIRRQGSLADYASTDVTDGVGLPSPNTIPRPASDTSEQLLMGPPCSADDPERLSAPSRRPPASAKGRYPRAGTM